LTLRIPMDMAVDVDEFIPEMLFNQQNKSIQV